MGFKTMFLMGLPMMIMLMVYRDIKNLFGKPLTNM